MLVELKRVLLIFVTTPFMALGAVWQIVAGGFMAGRIVTTEWTGKLARDLLAKRFGPDVLKARGQSDNKVNKGLH